MKTSFIIICSFVILFWEQHARAQNNRISNHNQIGWYNCFATVKINDKWGVHGEYQWRRNHFVTNWQQSLLRFGLNYSITPRILTRFGYAHVETFPYGDIPLNAFGKAYSEHRVFEMIQIKHQEELIFFSHRFMLEQRFVGRYNSVASTKEDAFTLLHRVRYMFRLQVALKGREIKEKTPYFTAYNEILIGFGKNVSANIFDQNRSGLILGYRCNKYVNVEAGYMNQTLQFGRLFNGKNVFQYNNGIIISAYFDLALKTND
jgi:hypothetical protein